MVQLLEKLNPALRFVLVFVLVNLLLTGIYSLYLITAEGRVDFFTALAGNAAVSLLDLLGLDAFSELHAENNSVWIYLNNIAVVQVIEGCNGIAVAILFVAFNLAFKGILKQSALYSVVFLITIWVVNVFRIGWLAYVIQGNGYEAFSWHKSIFTASIYIYVLMLWLLWVRIVGKKTTSN
jgi:exosortase family protein XrtF